jgi:hypothetical protein
MPSYKQLITPNLNIGATRGQCLGYVDNAIANHISDRDNMAQVAYDEELALGNVRSGEPPVGVWVPIWFSLYSVVDGVRDNYGHVAWAYNHGNGWIEIHDSEVHSGARNPYGSINELLNWYRGVDPNIRYLGWSVALDGAQIVSEDVTTNNGAGSATKGKLIDMIIYKTKDVDFVCSSERTKDKLWKVGAKFLFTGQDLRWVENGITIDNLIKGGVPQVDIAGNELGRMITDLTLSVIEGIQ